MAENTNAGETAAERIEAYLVALCEELLPALREAQDPRHGKGLRAAQCSQALLVRTMLGVLENQVLPRMRRRWGQPGATGDQRQLAADMVELLRRLARVR